MRLHFPNIERPKKAAKRIAKTLAGPQSLAKVQNAVAVALGYRDWHELETAHSANVPAPLDQELPVDLFRDRIAELALKLAVALGVTDSEAQYVLLVSRLTGDRQVSLDDHINIRLMCWRANGLWHASGHAGTVVRLRFPNAGPRRLGLLTADFGSSGGSPVQIVGDNFFGICTREEISIPRAPLPVFIPLRLRFVYGVWTEPDGAKVLFSRDYAPMWRLRDGQPPQMVSPFEWIRHEHEEWFWEDATAPWNDRRRIAEEEARLTSYGVPALSAVADLLPLMVASTGNVPKPGQVVRDVRRPTALAG
jgi:hypothetical protein